MNLENCVAFGDEANDIQMLDYVGMGVCMKMDVREQKMSQIMSVNTPMMKMH